MRRMAAGFTAFFAFTATFLVLPVYAAPKPEPEPVSTSSDVVDLGSVEDPAPAADVQEGTTDPVKGVDDDTPTLTVRRTDVDEFSLVGVTWAYDAAVTDTLVQVRVTDADGDWGDWTEVAQETADQSTGADTGAVLRGGTSPLWTGPSTGVEVELVTRSGSQPTDVQLDLVDPGESDADSALGAPDVTDTAHAATTMPAVYSRAQWGADEKIRTWDPSYAATIKAATIHHTADSNDYTADQVPAIMRSIYRYHTVSLGWGDIGYNVIVDKFGRLWEGRYGGLASTVVGAHAGGFNTGTFGVSMLGNYDIAPTTQPMIDAVEAIIAWKFSLYGVDPSGSTTLTSSGGGTSKYAAGVKVSKPTIFAHRDVGATACPGRYGYAKMDEIRAGVVALMSKAEPTISARYAADAAWRAQLGAAVGDQQVTAGVTWQQYQGGYAYWTASTGAHSVSGAIWGVYAAAGGPAALGAPTTDEQPTPDGVGRFNHFAGGASVYWTPGTGAQLVKGQIRDLWRGTGWETGVLGYPTSGELAADTGGLYQTFQEGTVYFTPAGGAVEVHGRIATRWAALGGLSWAVPTSSQQKAATGVYFNDFSGDRSIYLQTGKPTWVVQGLIRARWRALGGPTGALGMPTTDEQSTRAGILYSRFQHGTVYFTPATGAHAVQDAIAAKLAALGGASSGIGVPTTDQKTSVDGVARFNDFASGSSIYWTKATGAHVVRGQIRELWLHLGSGAGSLGYPTSDERDTADGRGRKTSFANGVVFWTPAGGAHAVIGPIYDRYAQLGGTRSSLGYPTSNSIAVKGGLATTFEHGKITWTASTGKVTVTYD